MNKTKRCKFFSKFRVVSSFECDVCVVWLESNPNQSSVLLFSFDFRLSSLLVFFLLLLSQLLLLLLLFFFFGQSLMIEKRCVFVCDFVFCFLLITEERRQAYVNVRVFRREGNEVPVQNESLFFQRKQKAKTTIEINERWSLLASVCECLCDKSTCRQQFKEKKKKKITFFSLVDKTSKKEFFFFFYMSPSLSFDWSIVFIWMMRDDEDANKRC